MLPAAGSGIGDFLLIKAGILPRMANFKFLKRAWNPLTLLGRLIMQLAICNAIGKS
jgi:hypothetical protein